MTKQRVILWSAAVGEGCFWLLMANGLASWLGITPREESWLPLLFALLPGLLLELLHWQQRRGWYQRKVTFVTNLILLAGACIPLLRGQIEFLALVPYMIGLYQAIRRSNLLEQITEDGLHTNWRWQLPFLFIALLSVPGHPQTIALASVYFLAWVSLTLIRTTSSWRLSTAALLLMAAVLGLSTLSLNYGQNILWPIRILYYLFTQLLLLLVWPIIVLLEPIARWLASHIGQKQPQQNPLTNLMRAEEMWPEAAQRALHETPALVALKILAAVVIGALIMWWLWRSIQAREGQGKGESIEREALVGWRDLFKGPIAKAAGVAEPAHVLQILYRQLQRYGAHQGMPRLSHVTPKAYQQQLGTRQPASAQQVDMITELYMAWRYGDQQPQQQNLLAAKQAAQELAREARIEGKPSSNGEVKANK